MDLDKPSLGITIRNNPALLFLALNVILTDQIICLK